MSCLTPSPLPLPPARRASGKALAAGILAASLVILPFCFFGNPSGHDFQFHAASWLDAAGQWKQGVLYPRWAEWANYGHGEPRFIFYPPLSWMLGAALGTLLSWKAAPAAFCWLALVLASLSMFALARRWLPERAALSAAVFYAANPYFLLLVYLRSDFAELLSGAFFPLLVLGAVEESAEAPRARWRRSAWLALVFAAIWLANAPAGVLAAYTLAVLMTAGAVLRRSLRPLVTCAVVIGVGFLLAAFYIVPAAVEQRWVNIAQALSSGLRPDQNFLFTTINDPEHNLFNLIVSAAATLMILLAGLGAIGAGRGEPAKSAGGRFVWRTMLVLSAVSVALMFRVTSPAWDLLPKLRYLQFPWRWLLPLGVPFAFFLAAALERMRRRWIWFALLCACLAGTGAFFAHQAWWDREDIPALRAAIASGQGYEGADEYDSLGDDHYNLPQRAPRVALLPSDPDAPQRALPPGTARLHVEKWSPEEKLFNVEAREPVRAAVRLLNYPAWRVEVNSRPITPDSAEDTAQMVLALPAGESEIRIRFRRTPDRTLGLVLSCLGLLVFFGLAKAGKGSLTGPLPTEP